MKLPRGWEMATLGHCCEILTGFPFESARYTVDIRGIRLLRGDNIGQGFIRWDDVKRWEIGTSKDLERFHLQPGDLVLAMDRTWVKCGLKYAVIKMRDVPSVLVQRVARLRGHDHFLTAFAACLIDSHTFTQYVKGVQTETAVPHISSRQIGDFPVPVPPLPEQRKIADILTTWDTALEKFDALIAAKERQKRALMRELLTGGCRRSSHDSWKVVRLAEVAGEQSVRNADTLDRTRLFAVTKAEGMVPMRERVQGATIHRCKVVEHGWFAYNPMRLNIGSIARWDGSAPVMVSGDYVVFCAEEERLLSDYLNYVRQSVAWANFVGTSGNGSVRIRIWFDDLGRFKFPLPPLDEQRGIVEVLDVAVKEIRVLRAQRVSLDQQKRGLMQRLLTGTVRVG